MALNIQKTEEQGVFRLQLKGRFDFNSQRTFRTSYDEPLANPDIRSVEIDLGQVDYLDSSALGMLLLLKERSTAANKELKLVNCHGTVKQVLEVANFNKLFTII